MLKDLIEKFQSTPKEYVGISLNANGLLEVIKTDRHIKTVVKYTNRLVSYNPISKEIENYEEFNLAIIQAFDELDIPKKSNVVVSLPNVLMGVIELPLILADDSVNNAIISEVEQSYMFKRISPVISWAELATIDERDTRRILYSAIQESVMVEITSIFSDLGCRLVSIQNSSITALQGLEFCEVTKDFINDRAAWNLIMISQTNYAIYAFMGNKIIDYFEEPLAIKSFSEQEVYAAISMVASNALKNFPTKNNLILSEADDVSAEVISSQLGLMGVPRSIEQNKFQEQPPIEVDFNVLPNYTRQISVSAIGTSIDFFDDKNVKINYLATVGDKNSFTSGDIIRVFGVDVELTKDSVMNVTVIICIVFFIVFGGFYFILKMINDKQLTEVSTLEAEEQKLQAELDASNHQSGFVDIYTAMSDINKANRSVMLYYDSLSYALPNEMWIQYFYADAGGGVSINGVAMSPEQITNFLKGIRDITGQADLAVSKLKIEGSDTEDIMLSSSELYSFQLVTPAFQNAISAQAGATGQQGALPQGQQPSPMGMPQQGQMPVPSQPGQMPQSGMPPANQPSSAPPVLPAPTN